MTTRVVLLTIVVFVALAATANCLPTVVQGDDQICQFKQDVQTPYDRVMQCFYSIPFNQTVREQTLMSLNRSMVLYTFTEASKNTPDPRLPVKVDIIQGLNDISRRPYRFDYDFHSDVQDLLRMLKDAHTTYTLPRCYSTFGFRQPFSPMAYVQDTGSEPQQVIAISGVMYQTLVDYYNTTMGLNPRDYIGAIIKRIDGVDALEFFKGFADYNIGVARDLSVRFNMAMIRPAPWVPGAGNARAIANSAWQRRLGTTSARPRRPIVRYDLEMPNGDNVTLDIPWVAATSVGYSSNQAFSVAYWSSLVEDTDNNTHNVEVNPFHQEVVEEPDADMFVLPLDTNSPNKINNNNNNNKRIQGQAGNISVIVSSPPLTFYELIHPNNQSRTMVMHLSSFSAPSRSAFNKAFEIAFTHAKQRNLTQLIVTLVNNGGGNICLGREILSYLQQGTGQSWSVQDVPSSPLQAQMTHQAAIRNMTDTPWSPAFYNNLDGVTYDNADESFITPGTPRLRVLDPVTYRNFSDFVYMSACEDTGFRPPQTYTSENIVILTHGYCGSTCAVFTNHASSYDNVRTVTVGGFPGVDMSFASFAGGQVYDSAPLFSTLRRMGFNVTPGQNKAGELHPHELVTSAAYRVAIREQYPKGTTEIPLELFFQPADVHMDFNSLTAQQPEQSWWDVEAKMFG